MFGLLKRLSFFSITAAQFLGALNDNALRQTYLLLVVGMGTAERQAEATALFALPFLIFSPLAGQLADRFSKRKVFIATKLAELVVMVLSAYALWIGSLGLLLLSILLMASQSVFFSPAKYGILPEVLKYEQLSHGNGIIQMTTYIAILLGTAVAGLLLQYGGKTWTGFVLVFFGLVGWFFTFFIEKIPPADEELDFDFNPFKRVAGNFRWMIRDSLMLLAVVGFVFSWLLGTILTLNVNVFGLQALGVGEALTSLLFVFLALGMGTGSVLAGWLSGEKIEYGLIIPGFGGLALCLLLLWQGTGGFYFSYIWMLLAGIFSGLFFIPLQSALQDRPVDEKKGEGLATSNIVTFTGVIVGTAVYVVLIQQLQVSARLLMLYMAVGSLVVVLLLTVFMPWLLKRFVICLFSALFFQTEIRGKENIPHRGPAVLKTGQISLSRALKLARCVPLPLKVAGRINMDNSLYQNILSKILSSVPALAGKKITIREETDAASALVLVDGELQENNLSQPEKKPEVIRVKFREEDFSSGFCSRLRQTFGGELARPVEITFKPASTDG